MEEGENREGAMATKETAAKEREEMKLCKQARLQMIIEATTRKALQDAREMENRRKMRALEIDALELL